ncbi:MAG: 8-hydroxy-5-deazaflavin:NADPH oxidoreductase [Solirubrobacterales bacterium]|jgi:predicted dinucleotide-binding enzyme|nr:8-hydroxy-5-deazaflavin:NADPH oxidoreductase [Solirubrobacterales bacterium]
MRVAVLGTGAAGRTIASRLLQLGHAVTMGSRRADGEALAEWVAKAGEGAQGGTFAEAAAASELVFNCTAGTASLEALGAAGAENLAGKTLVDVANPLDFSAGFPPTLSVCNDDSLAEEIQAAFPETRVVKSLNTVNCEVMVDPGRVRGDHAIFVCGDDDAAKAQVKALLEAIGWAPESIVDLGDLTGARATEMYVALWVRLYGTLDSADFNIAIAR